MSLLFAKDLAAKEMGFLHLSAGELLREERSRSGSTLAKEIEDGGPLEPNTGTKLRSVAFFSTFILY